MCVYNGNAGSPRDDIRARLGNWRHVTTFKVAAVAVMEPAVVVPNPNAAVGLGPAGGAAFLLGRGVGRADLG